MFQLARAPVLRQEIIVGVVLKSAAGRAVDVPEIGGRDRVTTGTNKGAPRVLFIAMPPPITSWISRTVKATWFRPRLRLGSCNKRGCGGHRVRRAQEYRTIDVAIGNLETEHLTIEGLDRRQLFDEEHHVAYVDRCAPSYTGLGVSIRRISPHWLIGSTFSVTATC